MNHLLLLFELLINEAIATELETQVDYAFSYSVEQPDIGLVTHHWEKRHGPTVTGGYSMLEPNGKVRIVEYRVDGSLGFKVFVKHRRLPDQFLGHLRYPYHYKTPIQLLQPVSLITADLFKPKEMYPNLPSTSY